MPQKLYLIGFMGAGKTAVGLRLAHALGAEFVDLDRSVEVEAGVPIRQIFEESGEEEFRRLEAAALGRAARSPGDCVIATGGGTVTRTENVEVMRSTGLVFWLDPSFEEILGRLDESARGERPLFASEGEARALFRARRRTYSAAGLRVAIAAGEGPEEVVERIRGVLSNEASNEASKVSHP